MSGPPLEFRGRVLVAGNAEGSVLAASEPLSFWGGYDQTTGEIIDRRHPLSGRCGAGAVLVLPTSRGSSTTAAVFLEAVRRGTAPAAVVTRQTDRFLALASVVADEMYGTPVPIVALERDDFEQLSRCARATVRTDGTVVAYAEAVQPA